MIDTMGTGSAPSAITVFVADDNLIVREGVRALHSLVAGTEEAHPRWVVTDVRMPPKFQQEGQ